MSLQLSRFGWPGVARALATTDSNAAHMDESHLRNRQLKVGRCSFPAHDRAMSRDEDDGVMIRWVLTCNAKIAVLRGTPSATRLATLSSEYIMCWQLCALEVDVAVVLWSISFIRIRALAPGPTDSAKSTNKLQLSPDFRGASCIVHIALTLLADIPSPTHGDVTIVTIVVMKHQGGLHITMT